MAAPGGQRTQAEPPDAGPLGQCRGDWAFYKQIFDFPSWSSMNICWKCSASRGGAHDYKDCSASAAWRAHRLHGPEFLAKQRAAGITPSALFQSPGFQVKHCMIDWLHTVDLGVVADALGQLFDEIIELLPGANRKERVNSLWQRVRAFYKEFRPPSELQALTPEMVKAPGQPAKLRAKAAQCRYLLPFGAALAKEFSGGSEHRATVSNLMQYLLEVTVCISTEPYDASRASAACRKFCLLYSALEKEALQNNNSSSWRCKPKLHLFQELIEYTLLRLVPHRCSGHIWMRVGVGGWPALGLGGGVSIGHPQLH